MKKLILLAGFYCLQSTLNATPFAPPVKNKVALTDASERAKRHFKNNYSAAQGETWCTLPDKEMYCMFSQDNTVSRVFYDKHGFWKYTLTGYSESNLVENVKERVLNEYDGYAISYVNEIRTQADEPIYIINIESAKSIKVIKVVGDDIVVQQSLLKQ
jgi:hypothetical protein